MQTTTSKLTRKYQATIPEPVRRQLHLNAGDAIAFDFGDDGVHVRKANPLDMAFAEAVEATLTEWASEADEVAYRDL